MKVALVYDRVNKWGGAERVLLALHDLFPNASLFTSVYNSRSASWASVFPKVIPSFLQQIPWANSHHEKIPFLMPIAFESMDFSDYDLVISVTSESAKGIVTKPDTKHICYCLTPTRYLWSGYEEYFHNSFIKLLATPIISYLRYWDRIAAHRPDAYITISSEVNKRISKYYSIKSEVVFPPSSIKVLSKKKYQRTGYLLVSRLVQYKKVDMAIEAFNISGLSLTIVGVGNLVNKLKKMSNDNITFLGNISDEKLSQLYSNSKALIMPQHEDFGLVAVEAQLHGTPVIAYGKGGALDTVKNKETGLLFNHQTPDSLNFAIKEFEKLVWDEEIIKKNAERFSKEKFKKEFMKEISKHV